MDELICTYIMHCKKFESLDCIFFRCYEIEIYTITNIHFLQFALMETVTTAILDKFPNLRQFKVWIVLFVAIFGYIGGLIFTTNVRLSN